jgi:hypothetical protein
MQLNLQQDDVLKGDPAKHVIGKDEEKPARKYPKRKFQKKPTMKTIKADIKLRMQEMEPIIEEYKRLEEAMKVLDA